MTDHHPTNFEIEIDRPGLIKYRRNMDLAKSVIIFVIAGALLGFIFLAIPLRDAIPLDSTLIRGLVAIAIAAGGGAFLGFLLFFPYYHLFIDKQAEARANELRVTVEGPFLRIRSGGPTKTDRKVHFRAIVDYSVIETRELEECGIRSLAIRTTKGTLNPEIKIPGIADCLKTRDLLAEIDALRAGPDC